MPKGRKKGFIPYNKTVWTDKDILFVKDNFHKMTNPQMAKALGFGLTVVRSKCYEMGLRHMEMEYWDEYHIAFLVDNYKEMGDTEMAEILQAVDPKNKGWSKKHVEKKRRYMGLKRTAKEKASVLKRNIELGCFAS